MKCCVHVITVPTRLQRPTCSCGWSPPLPWPVTWERWDLDARRHLKVTHPGHQHQMDDDLDRCPTCQEMRRGR